MSGSWVLRDDPTVTFTEEEVNACEVCEGEGEVTIEALPRSWGSPAEYEGHTCPECNGDAHHDTYEGDVVIWVSHPEGSDPAAWLHSATDRNRPA